MRPRSSIFRAIPVSISTSASPRRAYPGGSHRCRVPSRHAMGRHPLSPPARRTRPGAALGAGHRGRLGCGSWCRSGELQGGGPPGFEHPGRVLATVGLHPHDAGRWPEQGAQLTELAPMAAAIGETGLDFYRNLSSRSDQIRVFRRHVGLALELGKPIVVHCRDAFAEVIEVIEDTGVGPQTVMHCWTARPQMDTSLSRSRGDVLFRRAGRIRDRRYGEAGGGPGSTGPGAGRDRHPVSGPATTSRTAQRAGLGGPGRGSPRPSLGSRSRGSGPGDFRQRSPGFPRRR